MGKSIQQRLKNVEQNLALPGIDISSLANNENDLELKLHIQSRINLYERATAKGDDKTALSALQDIAKLQLLYPSDRSNATSSPDVSPYLEALGQTAIEVWKEE